MRPTYLAKKIARTSTHLALKYLPTVLGHPRNMQVNPQYTVCSMTIPYHSFSLHDLLKLSPEGEGFAPPKLGQ